MSKLGQNDRFLLSSSDNDKRGMGERKKGRIERKGLEFNQRTETELKEEILSSLGFSFKKSGAHVCRTMMLEDLEILLSSIDDVNATKEEYREAVVDHNILKKRSYNNRLLSFGHLVSLYALDPSILLFKTLRFFWDRDKAGRPLLALLCAYARDPVLRISAEYALDLEQGEKVSIEETERIIESKFPGRFSKVTLRSTCQNVNSSWTKAGVFKGVINKKRSCPKATSANLSYSLFLGYLRGIRGKALFESEYNKILNISNDKATELAIEASGKGWINFKLIGNLMEASFPNILSNEEYEKVKNFL
jgi:hypothetical protein